MTSHSGAIQRVTLFREDLADQHCRSYRRRRELDGLCHSCASKSTSLQLGAMEVCIAFSVLLGCGAHASLHRTQHCPHLGHFPYTMESFTEKECSADLKRYPSMYTAHPFTSVSVNSISVQAPPAYSWPHAKGALTQQEKVSNAREATE